MAELFAEAGEFLTEATAAWDSVPSPQGRPPLALLAHATVPYRLAAAHGDVVLVTPEDTAGLVAIRKEVESLREEADRPPGAVRVFADVNVVLGDSQEAADARPAGLDEAAGEPFTSDAAVFSGTPEGLADLLQEWFLDGGADGFRLRSAVLFRRPGRDRGRAGAPPPGARALPYRVHRPDPARPPRSRRRLTPPPHRRKAGLRRVRDRGVPWRSLISPGQDSSDES